MIYDGWWGKKDCQLVLLKDDHAKEGYTSKHYPIHCEDDHTQDPVVDVISSLHQGAASRDDPNARIPTMHSF